MKSKYQVVWTSVAENDLKEIIEYISRNNPRNALKTLQKIKDKTSDLYTLPERGRVVSEFQEQGISQYRELVVHIGAYPLFPGMFFVYGDSFIDIFLGVFELQGGETVPVHGLGQQSPACLGSSQRHIFLASIGGGHGPGGDYTPFLKNALHIEPGEFRYIGTPCGGCHTADGHHIQFKRPCRCEGGEI